VASSFQNQEKSVCLTFGLLSLFESYDYLMGTKTKASVVMVMLQGFLLVEGAYMKLTPTTRRDANCTHLGAKYHGREIIKCSFKVTGETKS
jgi:hypothetical protein